MVAGFLSFIPAGLGVARSDFGRILVKLFAINDSLAAVAGGLVKADMAGFGVDYFWYLIYVEG